jgi:hypothetical protein
MTGDLNFGGQKGTNATLLSATTGTFANALILGGNTVLTNVPGVVTNPVGANMNFNTFHATNIGTIAGASLQVTGGSPTTNASLLSTNNLGQTGWVVGPSFSAYTSVATPYPTATFSTGVFAIAEFNYGNCYNTNTYVFTPNVAGRYLFFARNRSPTLPPGGNILIGIFKNGARFKDGDNFDEATSGVQAIVDMNGITDYVNVFMRCGVGAWTNNGDGINGSYFQGSRLP